MIDKITSTKKQITNNIQIRNSNDPNQEFGILVIVFWDLPFDWAQGGESFDFAQDREPVERLVEPFGIWVLLFEI